jgi:hypothetical protein
LPLSDRSTFRGESGTEMLQSDHEHMQAVCTGSSIPETIRTTFGVNLPDRWVVDPNDFDTVSRLGCYTDEFPVSDALDRPEAVASRD